MLKIIQRSFINRSVIKLGLTNTIKPRRFVTRPFSTENTSANNSEDIHCIIKDSEKIIGNLEAQEFKAETRKLLDIVAKSLYSDKEVFVRELISNASDALEKLRYLRTTGLQLGEENIKPYEIHIKTNETKNQFIIQDTGIGMTKEEMVKNLGTIARSGSSEFVDQVKNENASLDSIIGKFGVGFYSSFMVADRVEVFSRSHRSNEGFYWQSSGTSGTFEICEADQVEYGTKIILHLKSDCKEFSDERVVEKIISKYSNYVGSSVYVNGRKLSMVQPLWLKGATDKVTEREHEEFYRYITGGNTHDTPRYIINFRIDVPLDIKSLFYIPSRKPTLYEISRESDAGVSLYSRKVMIMSRTQKLLPNWLRFLKGVVESDDIPLNLSRELLQDSALISKINRVLTGRVIKFLHDQAKRDTAKYMQFHNDFGLYLKEGIVNSTDQSEKENIAKLLRFESSKLPSGELTSFQEYAERMKAGSRKIYFFSAPSREIGEHSPYLEAVKEKDIEVLYLLEPYDEMVMMQLGSFDSKELCSIETEHSEDASNVNIIDASNAQSITQEQAEELTAWVEKQMKPKVANVRVTQRLTTHPCLVSVRNMGAIRHFIKTSLVDKTEEEKYMLMSATMELNPTHSLVKKLVELHKTDEELATMLVNQLHQNALVQAGLVTDSRASIGNLNELLAKAFEKI